MSTHLHARLAERLAAEKAADEYHRSLLRRRGDASLQARREEELEVERLLWVEQEKRKNRVRELMEAEQQARRVDNHAPQPIRHAEAVVPASTAAACADLAPASTAAPDLNRGSAGVAYRGAGSATATDVTRRPRVLIGVCLPSFLDPTSVFQHVANVHAIVCAFADVIVILSDEATDETAGIDDFERELGRASRRAQASAREHGAERTQLFSAEDGRTPIEGHPRAGSELAAALVRWADVLLAAPLSAPYLTQLERIVESDLLSAVVVRWRGYTERAVGAIEPAKPFIIAPRLEPLLRARHPLMQMLRRLGEQRVEIIEQPSDEERPASAGEGTDYYAETVAEHVRHGVMKAIGEAVDPSHPQGAHHPHRRSPQGAHAQRGSPQGAHPQRGSAQGAPVESRKRLRPSG